MNGESNAGMRAADALQLLAALRDVDWEQYLHDPSEDTSALSFLSGFGLGTLIGVIVAIMLAPQPGRRVREQVRHTGIELGQRGSRLRRRASARRDDGDDTLAEAGERAELELMRRMVATEEPS
jgi:gas vesicle protein